MRSLLVLCLLTGGMQERLQGAEFGTTAQHLLLHPDGRYVFERADGQEKMKVRGTWKLEGQVLQVSAPACDGGACGEGFQATLNEVTERVLLVKAQPPDAWLATGAYYCRYQGCRRRIGVELISHHAAAAVRFVHDFLIDKNAQRDAAHAGRALNGSSWVESADDASQRDQVVVWEGAAADKSPLTTQILMCGRSAEDADRGAQLIAADLAELTWLGKVEVKAAPPGSTACLYDVQVVLRDDATVPRR